MDRDVRGGIVIVVCSFWSMAEQVSQIMCSVIFADAEFQAVSFVDLLPITH